MKRYALLFPVLLCLITGVYAEDLAQDQVSQPPALSNQETLISPACTMEAGRGCCPTIACNAGALADA